MAEQDYRTPREGEGPRESFHVLSGCSGSGKSALLAELGRRGYGTVEEVGRQLVKEQLQIGGEWLPADDPENFVELLVSRSMYHFNTRNPETHVFFDRSIIDGISWFAQVGRPVPKHLQRATALYRYNPRAFFTPPWPEIFENDAERLHSFEHARGEYEALLHGYEHFGYEIVLVPRASVAERADFLLREAGLAS